MSGKVSKSVKPEKKAKTPVKPVEESESEEEETKVAPKKTNGKAAKKPVKAESSSEEEEKPVKSKKAPKKAPAPKPESSSEDEEMEETAAPAAEEEEEKEEEPETNYKKRKADDDGAQDGGEKRQKTMTIFLGGVSSNVTEDQVRELFADVGGNITAIRWMNDRNTGAFKGCGWVDFDNEEAVQGAMAFNGHELEGRALRVDAATPRGERPQQAERPAPSEHIVFVGGFSSQDSEENVVSVIKNIAEPTTYRLSKDRESQEFKGFGFFEFETRDAAQSVIDQLNGFDHDGQTLKAELSAPRQPGGGRGGRGGGFGGDRGGRGGGFGGGRGGRGGGFGGGRGGGFGGGRGGRGGFGDRGGRGGGFRGGRGRGSY